MDNTTEEVDLISGLNDGPSIGTSCCTGTLIDFSEDEVKLPFPNALMTIAEVDDTFGIFEMKPRSSSAPDSVSMSSAVLKENELSNSKRVKKKNCTDDHTDSKETLSGMSTISIGNDTSSATCSLSYDRKFNDAFVNNSTIADFGNETTNPDNYGDKSNIVNSTPVFSNDNDDAVFFSPFQSRSSTSATDTVSKVLEQIADSSVESDLLDIENLSTFSISDSSDTSSTETKKSRFEFLSPRKGKSPGSAKSRLKRDLMHKSPSNSRRPIPLTNLVDTAAESTSTPMVMALRKKMEEKKAIQEAERKYALMAPVPTRRIFPSGDMTDDVQRLTSMRRPSMLSSSFSSPEATQNQFALPTPSKEYAEARKQAITPVRPRTLSTGAGLPTPTKTDTPQTVAALATPSRSSYTKPSTPTGLARVMLTPTRSQYGSTQMLYSGHRSTPLSKRHSFSTSSSSDGSVSKGNVLSMDKVRSIPMGSLSVSIKSKPMAVGAPQVRVGDSRTMPRPKIGPMKAMAPIAGQAVYKETRTTHSFRSAANTSIASQNEAKTSEIRGYVSAPVHRKFAPPIAASSPKAAGGSSANNSFSLGTPTRNRNIRSSGYGQQAMNTSITKSQEPGPRIPKASPTLGNPNPRNIQQPQANTQDGPTGDKKRSASQSDATTSKIGRAIAAMPQFQFSRSTKENNVRQLRKPTFGK